MPVIITDSAAPWGRPENRFTYGNRWASRENMLSAPIHGTWIFRNANWKLLGELPGVPVLATFPRLTVDNGTVGGWPFIVRVVGDGKFMF